jgi:hypothetical protein
MEAGAVCYHWKSYSQFCAEIFLPLLVGAQIASICHMLEANAIRIIGSWSRVYTALNNSDVQEKAKGLY